MERQLQILAVGPQPPPVGGASISFQTFCNLVGNDNRVKLTVLNSSATGLKTHSQIFTFESLRRAIRLCGQFGCAISKVDKVLIFGSNGFVLSMVPLLLLIAKLAGKPAYVRVFGGSLDTYYTNLPLVLQRFLLYVLSHVEGIIVQTRMVYSFLVPLLGAKLYTVPGYRDTTMVDVQCDFINSENRQTLRLVYVGHIKSDKGVFILLDALAHIHQLDSSQDQLPTCDFYGPIANADEQQFHKQMAENKYAKYCGILPPEQVVQALRQYDVLVFPTYYPGEGHPGVLIEAMIAGIPVITTDFRSIPEIVQNGVNGLLVPPKDVFALVSAIQVLLTDRELAIRLGNSNRAQCTRYEAQKLVPVLLAILTSAPPDEE